MIVRLTRKQTRELRRYWDMVRQEWMSHDYGGILVAQVHGPEEPQATGLTGYLRIGFLRSKDARGLHHKATRCMLQPYGYGIPANYFDRFQSNG